MEEEEKVSFEESILKFAANSIVRMLCIYLNKVFFPFVTNIIRIKFEAQI